MANQFPTESTSSTPGGSNSTGLGAGSGASASIGNASGLGTGSTGSSSGSGFSGSAASTAANAAATAERSIDRTMDKAVQATHQAVDRAAGTVGQAAESLRARYDQLLDIEHEWEDTARSRVRENPLTSVAIAVAVGLVIGRLTAHR